ncbi:MAG: hypothetical protein V4463_01730 [Pseudomonadota bacterium]
MEYAIAYNTLAGGEALAKTWDPGSVVFQNDMTSTFPRQVDPATDSCLGMGGFSVGYERLIVMAAPCFNSRGTAVATHELTHEVQASVSNGNNARNLVPVWFAEGQPQVVGPVMAKLNGNDNYAAERAEIIERIVANRSMADLTAMEGETRNSPDENIRLSEYTAGAAMMEYLIARSGFKKSLAVLTLSNSLGKGADLDTAHMMVNFRSAFQSVYGQSLDDFYVEVLPYVNFLGAHYDDAIYYNVSALADEPGTKILLGNGCFAVGYTANLQQQVGATWVDIASAKGWNDMTSDIECRGRQAGSSFRPWTIAEVARGSTLRWHVYTKSDDWYSNSSIY